MTAIVIAPYDPHWPTAFHELAQQLRAGLGSLALRIDHIGSTSVPGLAAKDVIDLQITVAELDRDTIAAAVAPLGYTMRADIVRDHLPPGAVVDPREWTKLYLAPPPGQRATHLHIRQSGRANQRYPLLFRDYLRTSGSAVSSYRLIKQALARLHPDDPDAYYDVKDPVCDLIMESAELWGRSTEWTPGPSDA